jgi:hypothetical protein
MSEKDNKRTIDNVKIYFDECGEETKKSALEYARKIMICDTCEHETSDSCECLRSYAQNYPSEEHTKVFGCTCWQPKEEKV